MAIVVPLLIALSVIEIVSLYYLKRYGDTSNITHITIGVVGYIIIAVLLSMLFKHGKIGIINHSWNVITSIAAFGVGYLFFKENIDVKEFTGLLMSIVGVTIMLHKAV